MRTNYSDSFTASDLPFHLLAGGDLEFQQDGRKEFENNGLSAVDLQTASNDEVIGKVRIGNTLTDQDERVTAEGLFTKVECSPFALLTLMGGVRYDRYIFTADDKLLSDGVDNSGSVAMGNLSRMIGATYVLDDHHQVFANYSTSFEVPTTTELGNTPTGEGGFNTSLRPEHIVSLEGGVRGDVFVDAIRYSVSVYRMMIDGILIPYQIPNQPGDVLYYKNAGSAVNTGVECSLIWKPLTGMAISAVVSHMNFVYDSYLADATINGSIVQVQLAGNTIPGVPQDDIDLGVEYDFPFGLSAEFYTNRTGRMYGNDLNGPDSPTGNPSDFINDPFTTSQLKLDYTVVIGSVHANLFAGISNIFDARYNGSVTPNAAGNRFFEPSPPRNWYAGISMIFE